MEYLIIEFSQTKIYSNKYMNKAKSFFRKYFGVVQVTFDSYDFHQIPTKVVRIAKKYYKMNYFQIFSPGIL